MDNKARKNFFQKHKDAGSELKVFLSNKVMLDGSVQSFDDESVVLDECLIFYRNIISVTPK